MSACQNVNIIPKDTCFISLEFRTRFMKVRTITINWVTQPLNLNCFHHITLYYLLTYSMEHSPSEANRSSTSQEICLILWNPKVRYCLHKCPPHIPILSQLDPVHTLTSYFLNIYFIIILPCTPGSPDLVSFPQISEPKSCLRLSSPLTHTRYMPRPSHSFRFYQPKIIG